MTAIDVIVRKPNVIEGEINALRKLITRRHMWLQKTENKMRTTYPAIKKDTDEMEINLFELEDEFKESQKIK